MKIMAIVGSPRKGGNTDLLIDKVIEGAKSAGEVEVEKVYIYESDGGSGRTTGFQLYPGISCYWYRGSGDDYVDHGATYMTNFSYNRDYSQDLGNAYVRWHKVP